MASIPNRVSALARSGIRHVAAALALTLVLMLAGVPRPAAAAAEANPLGAVVQLLIKVPGDARSAKTLGTERVGSGVIIGGDGLIVTIGYLILEAEEIMVVTADGGSHAADYVGYDHTTGFGLIRALTPLGHGSARLGSSAGLAVNDSAMAAGAGGPRNVAVAQVVSRRTFAGGWEYMIDDAIFTAPPIPEFGGAALFDRDGRLLGIGSLIVRDGIAKGRESPANMFVPIDLLKPILSDLLAFGQTSEPARPWLGLYPAEADGVLVVTRVTEEGPAAKAGLRRGDLILGVDGKPVHELETFFRSIWALGSAGVVVPLDVMRSGNIHTLKVTSGDRRDSLRQRRSY
jgi:S1-C subfamily serine protease